MQYYFESSKLRALCAHVVYVSLALSAPMSSLPRALRAPVSRVSRAPLALMSYVFLSLCAVMPHMSCASRASRSRLPAFVSFMPRALHALCTNVTFCALVFPPFTCHFLYLFPSCEFF